MAEEFFRPFAFYPHTVGDHGVGFYRRFVRLKQCVEAVKGGSGVGCLVVSLGYNEARGIGASWEFDGLGEVADNLAETFKVVAGRFSSDGQELFRPALEDGGYLLDSGLSGDVKGRLGRQQVA